MLDHAEFSRWLEASDDEARLAVELVGLSAFNAVVLHTEQSARSSPSRARCAASPMRS